MVRIDACEYLELDQFERTVTAAVQRRKCTLPVLNALPMSIEFPSCYDYVAAAQGFRRDIRRCGWRAFFFRHSASHMPALAPTIAKIHDGIELHGPTFAICRLWGVYRLCDLWIALRCEEVLHAEIADKNEVIAGYRFPQKPNICSLAPPTFDCVD